jgi:hypothetical protein
MLRWPSIGFDSAVYHYPTVAGWIENGRPGSGLVLSYDIPYESYPLTDETALTWGAGLARSWVPIALWNPSLYVLLGLASWTCLRALAVGRRAAGLATAALMATPLVVVQVAEAQTDLPALTWLACAAALAATAARWPTLLATAIVAAGLAVGTKPSTGPLAVAVVAIGVVLARGRLRGMALPLALGLAGAVVVGGLWSARNLIEHGSPLWPHVATPWGDPAPRFLSLPSTTFLERPLATLEGRVDQYATRLAGGWLLLGAAVLAPVAALLARACDRGLRRRLLLGGGLTLAALLVWSVAWGTGLQTAPELTTPSGWSLSALRFMLPALGVATITVALATRIRGPVGAAATALLVAALAYSLARVVQLGTPSLPRASTLLLGVLAGLAVLGAATLARRPLRRLPAGPRVALACVVVAGALLSFAGEGYVERYTRVRGSSAPGADVLRWLLDRPGWRDGRDPVAFASRAMLAPFAGDRFTHPLRLVPQRAPCPAVIRLARHADVVVTPPEYFGGLLGIEPYAAPACFAGRPPAFRSGAFRVYRFGSAGGSPRPARDRAQRTRLAARAAGPG